MTTDATVAFQDSSPESGQWNYTSWKRALDQGQSRLLCSRYSDIRGAVPVEICNAILRVIGSYSEPFGPYNGCVNRLLLVSMTGVDGLDKGQGMTKKNRIAKKMSGDGANTSIEYCWYDARVVGRRRNMPYPGIYELYLDGWVERPLMDWDTNADPLTEEEAIDWIAKNASNSQAIEKDTKCRGNR